MHMCNSRDKFISLKTDELERIYIAENKYVESQGVGIASMKVKMCNRQFKTFDISDALYVSSFRKVYFRWFRLRTKDT